jgi:mono/diheme cytochrome c family protein
MRVMKRSVLYLAAVLSVASGFADAQYPPAAQCPQPRVTGKAPDEFYSRSNPLGPDPAQLAAGRRLYEKDANPGCQVCHGIKGDGMGPMSGQFDPPPRNFACAQTVKGIPDGQFFWIIQNGSPGTSMPSFGALREEQIWQLVRYLRVLAK